MHAFLWWAIRKQNRIELKGKNMSKAPEARGDLSGTKQNKQNKETALAGR